MQVSKSGRDFFLRKKLIELPMNQNIFKGAGHIWEAGGESYDKYIENKTDRGKEQLPNLATESTSIESILQGSTESSIYLEEISKLCMQIGSKLGFNKFMRGG